MCGLVGVIGAPSKVNRHVFQDMLAFGAKRGPHSTGIVAASRKAYFTLKDATLPWELMATPQYKENIVGKQWPVLMGHNRWATIGKVNTANAHPFLHKDTILMHNGTLEKGHELDKWDDFDTDSECLTYNIATHGLIPTYKKMSGAWTLTWWDAKLARLNVVSNGHRPFNFILSRDKRNMYYASEEWTVRFACEGRDVELEKMVWTLTPHKLYSFYTNKKGEVEYEFAELEARPLPPLTKTSYHSQNYYDQIWGGEEEVSANEDAEIGDLLGYSGSSSKTKSDGEKKGEMLYLGKAAPKVRLLDDAGRPIDRAAPHGSVKHIFQTEEAYKTRFGDHKCALCGTDMKDEYETALMIDPELVACGLCHDFCELNSVKLA